MCSKIVLIGGSIEPPLSQQSQERTKGFGGTLNSRTGRIKTAPEIKCTGYLKMANKPRFTDHDIELIIRSLPDGVDNRRLKLLPRILREWAKTDLPLNLLGLPMRTIKGRNTRLSFVEICARKLSQALDAVNSNDEQFYIIREMIVADGMRSGPTEQIKLENNFEELEDFLRKLTTASSASAKIWKRGRGQPRNVAASLALVDIVTVLEWLTGKRATREVDRVSNKDTGPLWEFSKAIWPLVFGNEIHGLSAAIRNWDNARKKRLKGIHSPLLANIALRHPTWRIFES